MGGQITLSSNQLMKLKIQTRTCCFGALCLLVSAANADVTVSIDGSAPWLGYMNVFNLPTDGGTFGAFQFGGAWGVADLTSSFAESILTLGPNTINDPAPYWYTPSGGPGSTGNKTMDANLYVETTGTFTGQNLTFTGLVLQNTLVSPYTSVAFIKDFTSDYSSFTMVTLSASGDPTHHVQYGFETVGPNVWATDVGPKGLVRLTAVPEPSTAALVILGIMGLALRNRSRLTS